MSNKNNNNTTNIKCSNFVGNTCLDWPKEWFQYAQNLGVDEIISKGTYGGENFKEMRSPFKSKTELLSVWISEQNLLKNSEIHAIHYRSKRRLSMVTICNKSKFEIYIPWLTFLMKFILWYYLHTFESN